MKRRIRFDVFIPLIILIILIVLLTVMTDGTLLSRRTLESLFKQAFTISFRNTSFQNSAFYNPAVDEKYLILSVCAGKRRFGDVSGDSRFFSAVVYGNKIFIFFQLVNRENGGQQISVSRRRKEDIAVIDQTELYLGIGQSDLRDKIDDSAAFRRIGFKKLSSGRRIVEEICDQNRRSVRTARGPAADHLSAVN